MVSATNIFEEIIKNKLKKTDPVTIPIVFDIRFCKSHAHVQPSWFRCIHEQTVTHCAAGVLCFF